MANTWNKIKNKFKLKKRGSRSRNHRKAKKNRANHPSNSSASNINTPTLINRRKNQFKSKKKSNKSNIFGCFSAVPKEYVHRNVEQKPPQLTTKSVSKHLSSPPPSITIPITIPHQESTNSPLTPVSPSKSKTDIKYIEDNQSVHSVCSEIPSIKYNMTPTPRTMTEHDYYYDIYEGVLEVENDNIIDEDGINSYYDDDDMDQQRDSIIIKSPQLDRDSHEGHGVMEDELMDNTWLTQLNEALRLNGYNNPSALWAQHIQNDRGAQISNIWRLECEKKKMEIDCDEDDDIKIESESASQSILSTLSEELDYYDGDLFHEKYMVGTKINEGGFGSVWKIIDNNLYSKCVKIMDLGCDCESQNRRRKACVREYNMTRKAFSDEIVEVELFMDNVNVVSCARAYLIMPYFEGKDLFEFIDDEDYFKKVSVETILHIFYKICEKLYDLHYFKKIVHGDLKPENVMILQSDSSDEIEVEIIDYGIAKSVLNLSSSWKYLLSKGHFGTKGYVAPELMIWSKYNLKIDVFSAGVVLYNMVTECCLFPKGHKYYRLSEAEYYKYLKKKFKCIKRKKLVINILYSCLAYDPDERLDVKQLIRRYFDSKR